VNGRSFQGWPRVLRLTCEHKVQRWGRLDESSFAHGTGWCGGGGRLASTCLPARIGLLDVKGVRLHFYDVKKSSTQPDKKIERWES